MNRWNPIVAVVIAAVLMCQAVYCFHQHWDYWAAFFAINAIGIITDRAEID